MKSITFTIAIKGDSISRAKLGKALSSKKWEVTKKGTEVSKSLKLFAPQDVWSHEVGKIKNLSVFSLSLCKKISDICKIVKNAKLPHDLTVTADLFFNSEMAEGFISVPPAILLAVASCDIPLSISIISFGGVPD